MRLVTFEKDGRRTIGSLMGDDKVVDLPSAYEAYLASGNERVGGVESLPSDMTAFLDQGDSALDAARKAAEPAEGADRADGKLCAPVPAPRKVFLLAGNYEEHIREGTRNYDDRRKEFKRATPRIFMKPPTTTVCGPGDPVLLTKITQKIDWEGELAAVIGKRCKHVSAEEALDYVVGYTALNDISERALKIKERDETEPWDTFFDWLNGKWLDSFSPMGPCLVTKDEIPDPHALDLSLKVNDETMQSCNTGAMIHTIPQIIEYLTAIITLEPGDIISTGTPAGVGSARGIFLKAGDVVTLTIEGIGSLANPVEQE